MGAIEHSLRPRTFVAVHSHCYVSVSGLQRRVCVLCTRLSACCAEVRLVPAARLAQLRAALAVLLPPPPASALAVGMIVEWRNPGETAWSPGYVTSVEPLKVTVNLVGGPAATGCRCVEVRLLPAARLAQLQAELAASLPPPPASALAVGMVVERRDPGEPWAKGYALCVDAVPLVRSSISHSRTARGKSQRGRLQSDFTDWACCNAPSSAASRQCLHRAFIGTAHVRGGALTLRSQRARAAAAGLCTVCTPVCVHCA